MSTNGAGGIVPPIYCRRGLFPFTLFISLSPSSHLRLSSSPSTSPSPSPLYLLYISVNLSVLGGNRNTEIRWRKEEYEIKNKHTPPIASASDYYPTTVILQTPLYFSLPLNLCLKISSLFRFEQRRRGMVGSIRVLMLESRRASRLSNFFKIIYLKYIFISFTHFLCLRMRSW